MTELNENILLGNTDDLPEYGGFVLPEPDREEMEVLDEMGYGELNFD